VELLAGSPATYTHKNNLKPFILNFSITIQILFFSITAKGVRMNELTNIEEMFLIVIWRLKSEAYGYRIRNFISDRIEKEITYGNLYSVLSQLVKKGYVTKKADSSETQGRGKNRVFYSVSKEGINALQASKVVHNTLWEGISNLATEES
jgi:DNA-binding PadR family transcriptional regulator